MQFLFQTNLCFKMAKHFEEISFSHDCRPIKSVTKSNKRKCGFFGKRSDVVPWDKNFDCFEYLGLDSWNSSSYKALNTTSFKSYAFTAVNQLGNLT